MAQQTAGTETRLLAAHREATNCTPWSLNRCMEFETQYVMPRSQYRECIITYDGKFDVELISKLAQNMVNGKAAKLDEL